MLSADKVNCLTKLLVLIVWQFIQWKAVGKMADLYEARWYFNVPRVTRSQLHEDLLWGA